MTKNPILDELRRIRERLLAESGGTLDGLVSRLQDQERVSGRRIVSPTRSRAAASHPSMVDDDSEEE